MVQSGVLFEVRTGFLNIIEMSLGFKGIIFSFQHLDGWIVTFSVIQVVY
jgi:hypothetical protein